MEELPLGFGMALSQHPESMQYFALQSPEMQKSIISRAHNIHSKEEMHRYVTNLPKNSHTSQTN